MTLFPDEQHAPAKAIQLFDFQEEDRAKTVDAFLTHGKTRLLGVWPTGSGKAVLFSELHLEPRLRQWIHSFPSNQRQILILAHRDELIDQAVKRVHRSNPDLAIGLEKADQRARPTDDVVVASVQTLAASRGKRLRRMDPDRFRLVIVDEAHHAASPSYLAILQHFGFLPHGDFMAETRPPKRLGRTALLVWQRERLSQWDAITKQDGTGEPTSLLLGLTATPKRGDKIGLECVFQDIAFERSLREMIQRGRLCRPRAFRVQTDTSIDAVGTRAGDFEQEKLAATVNVDQRNVLAVKAYLDFGEGRKGMTFAANVAHATALAEMYRQAGVPAEVVYGAMPKPDRKRILREFSEGTIRMLTNCNVLTEGFDEPDVQCIVHARPTKSKLLYCLDSQTEILTTNGWKGLDGIEIGDLVAGFDQFSGRISWQPATGKVVRQLGHDEQMIAMHGTALDIRVTDKHRMVHYHKPTRSFKIETAQELLGRESVSIPVGGIQSAPGIPLSAAEIAFCGLVQTDGCVNKNNGAIQISQSSHHVEACNYIERTLTGCGFKWRVSEHITPTNFGRRAAPMRVYRISKGKPKGQDRDKRGWGALERWIWKAGCSWTAWDMIDVAQFRVLVCSLWWGDGLKPKDIDWKNQTTSICSADLGWCERFQSLAVRRGWRCNLSAHPNGESQIYYLRLRELTLRHLPIKASDSRPVFQHVPARDETVWCITVPSGAFIARRGGKPFVTGNCQMTGRGLRVAPNKPDCIIIDIVDITKKHSLMASPELLGLPLEFDAKGGDLLAAKEHIESLQQQFPIANLDDVKSLDECQLRVQEVDLLANFHDDNLDGKTKLTWEKTGEGYEVSWKGPLLNEFARVAQTPDGQWTFRVDVGKRTKLEKAYSTAQEALAQAEQWIQKNKPSAWGMNMRWEKDANEPAHPTQIATINSFGMGYPVNSLTRGQARKIMAHHYNEYRRNHV